MGKPRLIILIRHAQSEGNKNREIHQMIPDHRVKLTDEGHKQAEEAGRRLRSLLRPDDTLQIYTSPYRRTRETTEGILKTLTARNDPDDPSAAPSPFSREKIKVYEEPRIREQDFGNFQPCSAEMERMWQERADYGHFFYRIANGESAADAYDRISGFNESLWRQFGDGDFPSVCVLVTHGLMTRVFLMKWYHWSVEYFEDLRNINHCEFIQMRKDAESGKYVLQNDLRTWSELKRQKRIQEARDNPQRRNTLSNFLTSLPSSPVMPVRQWGGCVGGCDHNHDSFPRRSTQKKPTTQPEMNLPSPAGAQPGSNEISDHPIAGVAQAAKLHEATSPTATRPPARPTFAQFLRTGRDGGGTSSGANTPHELSDEESPEYFDAGKPRSLADAMRKPPQRQATHDDIQRWARESGMGNGTKADALGDEPDEDETEGEGESAIVEVDLDQAEKDDKGLRGTTTLDTPTKLDTSTTTQYFCINRHQRSTFMSEPSHSWSDFFGRVESSVSDGESRDAAASLSVPASPPQRIDTVLQRTPGVSTMYTIEEQSEDEFLEDNSAEEARAAHSERTGTNSQKKSSSPKKRNAALERGMRHYGSMSEKPECESAGHEWQQRNREGPSNFAGSMEPLTGQQPSYGQDLELEIKRFTEIIHRAFAPGASGASLESARQLNQFVARGSAPDRATEAQKSYRHYSKDQESQDDVASDERSNGYHPLCSSM